MNSDGGSSFEYVASACLCGFNCKYDGGSNPCAEVVQLYRQGRAKPLCPESLSGLPVPRPPCEQKQGRVVCKTGEDVTEAFERGAQKALELALASGASKAILKSRSPSCGYGQVYDGTFSRKLCKGNGLFAQKLASAGFEIFSEENLPESALLPGDDNARN